jgi:hypothetical protein
MHAEVAVRLGCFDGRRALRQRWRVQSAAAKACRSGPSFHKVLAVHPFLGIIRLPMAALFPERTQVQPGSFPVRAEQSFEERQHRL